MTQRAGQMLPAGDPLAVSIYWVAANRRAYPRRIAHDFYKRWGRRAGHAAIWRIRVPSHPGWLVLLRDDPTQPDLPPTTPDVGAPPSGPPSLEAPETSEPRPLPGRRPRPRNG